MPGEVIPSVLDGDGDQGPVVTEGPEQPHSGHALPFPIVGVGGSAGALESLVEFFENLPSDTGMAFVVVLHLAANQESHLAAIIGRHTSMPTQAIEDGAVPERDHVYMIPPNAQVALKNGVFRLEERPSGKFLPVNVLLQSLASEQKNFAVGVILSGMDGDGAIGLRAIKGEGGFSLVQTPESARHAGMPRASIENDHVDMVLPPDLIGTSLASLAKRFGDAEWQRVEEGEANADEQRYFSRILRMLKSVSGVDFRLYKPPTIRRRVARRMLMHKLQTLADYVLFLQANPTEVRQLQEDILISVTRFFRDPEVFRKLKSNVIPHILSAREPDQQIRIWVAGCSSGEEAYSIAMVLLEHVSGSTMQPSIQIFGTDASEENIQKARLGLYPESLVNEVSQERLRRFFTKVKKGYQISKRVRDLCIFARQNLSTDPPFSRLDLVSCRNVLIYFGPQLQRQVISTFHYALRPEGYLLLGSSETIREFSEIFRDVDRANKVFQRKPDPVGRKLLGTQSSGEFSKFPPDTPMSQIAEIRKDFDLNRIADRIILARYTPPVLVLNQDMEILQSRGRTGPFIEMAQGMASLQLARESIAPQLTAAVARAIQEDLPVQVDGVEIKDGDATRSARIEVLPMHTSSPGARYFLVVFVSQGESVRASAPMIPPPDSVERDSDRSIAQLQHDLATTKMYLQSLLDERDSKNQELISANEEIQSANEELQSTNEELETTKEELQSSNEELQTVNDELQNRNAVLTQASNDLNNLLNSVNLPVLMLSNELTIRHFTPHAQRLISVRQSDIGRPFGEIRLNLAVEDLEARLLQVLETLAAQEFEVQDRDGRWYLLRVRPYRTSDNKIEGLVVVLVDVDQSRRSQQELRQARDFASSVIENVPLPLVVVNSERKIHSANDAFCTLSGMNRQMIESRGITDLAAGLWDMEVPLLLMLQEVQEHHEKEVSFECEHTRSEGGPRTLLVRGRSLQPDGEHFVLVTFEDISAHKHIENLLKREGERLAQEVVLTTRELDQSREELRALTDSLMTSQEDERRRLARELHDDVSQRMALLDMECGTALQALQSDDAGSARRSLEAVRSSIAEISQDVRTLSHRLHPSIIEHLGPAAALESLIEEFAKREGMLTTFFAEDVPAEIPVQIATGLYRISQEALRNVIKHAGRAHVKLSLWGEDNSLHLQVADSGVGFDVNSHLPGLGLVSMKERARLIGATLTVHSAPRQGTCVDVHVPLPPEPIN